MLMISFHRRAVICLALTGCILTGCNVGPKYHTPPANPPAAYKELTPDDYKNTDGWKVAQPKDDALRGKWWEIFGDPQLNALEEKVNISNQKHRRRHGEFLCRARRCEGSPIAALPSRNHQPRHYRTTAVGHQFRRQSGGSGFGHKFHIIRGGYIC